ncbi:MAG: hypothetical protein AB2660_18340 [Candidatus Thiodiazotropha sp.]
MPSNSSRPRPTMARPKPKKAICTARGGKQAEQAQEMRWCE